MPKWTDYTIKTDPADKDEVMILDTAGKANKRLSLSALSDLIIGKIANKVFENLQTQNKTILGAINELNSNKTSSTLLELSNNIDNFLNKTSLPTAYFVWGTIGGLFGGWAWGVLICAKGIANFIGIRNDNKTLAVAHYENGAWSKISTWS